MSGPVSPPLTVKESDGSVSVRPTNTISFNAADFTVSGTGAEATISIDSTGTGAALTATQIGFGNASNVMTSSNLLVFIDTPAGNEALGVGLAAPNEYSSNATTVQIHDATTAELRLTNSTTGSSGTVGQLLQAFQDDLYIFNAEASGKMFFSTNKTERMQIDSGGLVTITGSGTDDLLMLKSTDAGADSAPDFVLFRDTASVANNDFIGQIDFRGKDGGGGSDINYGKIVTRIMDTSNDYGRMGLFVADGSDGDPDKSQVIIERNNVVINNANRGSVGFLVKKGGSGRFIDCQVSTGLLGLSGAPTSGGADVQVKGSLESLEQSFSDSSATLALTDAQCRNSFVQLAYDTAAMAVTLPTAVTGMKVTLARMQPNNAPTIVAQSGEKINGVTSPSTISIGTQYQVVVLHGITGTGWVAYEPAVAA